MEKQLARVTLIQRHLKLGYAKALRLIEAMVAAELGREKITEDRFRQLLQSQLQQSGLPLPKPDVHE